MVTAVTDDLQKSIVEQTDKTIDAIKTMQQEDQKFMLEMQQKDQQFLTQLFGIATAISVQYVDES